MNNTNNTTYVTYTITNKITGRTYFGMTQNLEVRFVSHEYYLSVGRHSNKHLQADYKLCGIQAFEFSVIRQNQTKDQADRFETQLIHSNKGCYNERKSGAPVVQRRGPRYVDPLLTRAQCEAILARKGTAFGYVIAAEFGVSPSLVSNIFTGKYACGFTTLAS